MGIIAIIVAAVKGQTTFAWILGIWEIFAVILALNGFQYAFGPGLICLIIAACMTNEREAEKARQEENRRKEEAHRIEMEQKRKEENQL